MVQMPKPDTPPVHSVSWQDFDAMIESLASQLSADNLIPDCIVGIARGGCVPAVALSHVLAPSDFYVIRARVHGSDAVRAEKGAVHVESLAGGSDFGGQKVLLVDDALHTGATALACHEFVMRSRPDAIYFAALLRDTFDVNDPTPLLPCPVITAGSVNAWIIFPWEPKVYRNY